MESDYELYRYEYPLNLEAGESFAKDMSISLGARIDQMYVKVMDQEGREAASKRLKLNVSMETAELFVGILSDTPGPPSVFKRSGRQLQHPAHPDH